MWYSSSSNCIKYVSVEESELLHGLTLSTHNHIWIHTYSRTRPDPLHRPAGMQGTHDIAQDKIMQQITILT